MFAHIPASVRVRLFVVRFCEGRLSYMNSRAARMALVVIGVIALLVGAVFAGQGIGLIPGSFMTGSRTWLDIGVIVAIVGIVLIVLGVRRKGRGRS